MIPPLSPYVPEKSPELQGEDEFLINNANTKRPNLPDMQMNSM